METLLQKIPDWITLEHRVAEILTEQEVHGWYFNERAAWELESTLRKELESLTSRLREEYPLVQGSEFEPKRDNKTKGYVAGAKFTRLKEFNPTSRDHIAWVMMNYHGWKPTVFTDNGKPTIDEVVLKDIGTEISLTFYRCLELTKMLGMLSGGVNAWLKLVNDDHRIRHHCSVATNTFRCAHRKPNLAQTPSDGRFRALFTPSPGQVMVGADLSGVELRMLSHYLARYDDGRYADVLINGDIHQENADKIGISRRLVKTVTYAFLYGAGDTKIGLSYDPQLAPRKAAAKGKEIRKAYLDAIPGLETLVNAVKKASERGFIRAIDDRKVSVDGAHKALNYLLQSSAACLAKRWLYINHKHIKELDLCCSQLAFIHDEIQFESAPECSKDLCTSLVLSAQEAGEYYRMRCPISAEAKEGSNWSEVH